MSESCCEKHRLRDFQYFWSDTNQALQPFWKARGFDSTGPVVCSGNEGADHLHGTIQLICVFVFTYAKSRFFSQHSSSVDEAFLQVHNEKICLFGKIMP